ncbi:MAG: metal ABC transporter permease, partial [Candidatus Thermoplasmatota archaeon]|nr:metal ABC transporter permease [Candidatus Thermoplasmatota archaeon]
GITTDVEGYLFGSLLLIDSDSLDIIVTISLFAILSLAILYRGLLAMTIDAVAARLQGIPVNLIGLWFSVTVAAIVVTMVKVVGALLVSALLVTPAATAQLISRSFRSCLLWTQVFGFSATILGIFFSAELNTGSGSMIAVVAASQFVIVGLIKITVDRFNTDKTPPNLNV